MNANQIVNFLEQPLINLMIYLAIFCVIAFSLFKYKRGQKEYASVVFGFLLLMAARIIVNLRFIYHILPQTFLGVIVIILTHCCPN